MICSVCKKNKETVTPKQSELQPSIRLFLCNECLEGQFEPRYIIVLTGRGGDIQSTRPYIKGHRYVGNAITMNEMMV